MQSILLTIQCEKGSLLLRESKEPMRNSSVKLFYFVNLIQMIQYGWDRNAKFRCYLKSILRCINPYNSFQFIIIINSTQEFFYSVATISRLVHLFRKWKLSICECDLLRKGAVPWERSSSCYNEIEREWKRQKFTSVSSVSFTIVMTQCITLPRDDILTECEGALHIRKSTTVIFWINCQLEAMTLFNTKFQAKNSVSLLHQSPTIILHHQGKI